MFSLLFLVSNFGSRCRRIFPLGDCKTPCSRYRCADGLPMPTSSFPPTPSTLDTHLPFLASLPTSSRTRPPSLSISPALPPCWSRFSSRSRVIASKSSRYLPTNRVSHPTSPSYRNLGETRFFLFSEISSSFGEKTGREKSAQQELS